MKLDMAGVSVMLAMPTHRDIPAGTVASLLATQDLLTVKRVPFEVQLQVGNSLVTHARSKIAHTFLQSDKSLLFWVDSDIEWKAADFLRLCALATKMDVVGGAYPAKKDPITFFLDPSSGGEIESNEYGCLKIGGWGMGFTVVTRRVIEALADKSPKLKFNGVDEPIAHIFRCDEHNGYARGEDMAFFADAKDLGFEAFLDPSITLGHIGSKTYTASIADMLRPIEGESDGTS
ncbi:hypothetical protein [Bradyrhizobium sp. AZCC 1578]|uniref:hypothetical protein n=1 Tax=Bradyrhizobium sp. AZCC 1578 TaxID=3117027 RepID=UPI002FF109D7